MRNLTLGGLLVLTSAAAVAYVYRNPELTPCTVCRVEPADTDEPATGAVEPSPGDACCPKCKSNVVDVVDLSTAYPVGSPLTGTNISFDEPPLAKPRSQVILPAQFELPATESAPPPRDAAELAPSPRILK